MEAINGLHKWWQNIGRLGLVILMLGSYALFLITCWWWDGAITLKRNVFFAWAWGLLNLLRAPGPEGKS